LGTTTRTTNATSTTRIPVMIALAVLTA
jgi:hypothetical protein